MNSFVSQVRQVRRHTVSVFAAGVCLLAAACGQTAGVAEAPANPPVTPESAAPTAEAPAEGRVVVFLGDSLTAGYGLAPEDALPQQMEAIWRAKGIKAVAVNAGVSGDTTANGLARFDWSVTAAKPDLLVVALGANDFLLGVPADVTRANLAAILDRAKSENISAVLVGIEFRGDVRPGSREAAFAAIYPELAEAHDVPYYPSLLGEIEADPSMLQRDGLHPTKEGVARISASLSEFLEPVIASIDE